ncbi:MAG: hypothetical protein PVF27_10570, partial [Gemmatimonadales bacterium]
ASQGFDWLPCYAELVRYRLRDHWAIRAAWGDSTGTPEEIGHQADYLVTARGRARILGEVSCE